MNPIVRLCLFALLAAGAFASGGDQGAPPAPASAPPAAPTPTPPAAPATTPGPELEEFVPTEKVPADEAVAFPVDI
jgi:hypothetical protein